MDRLGIQKKLTAIFDKYKYVLLIIAVGFLLMLWPDQKQERQAAIQPSPASQEQTTLTEELCAILGQIRGVGKVRVMITEQTGPETHYQTDHSGSQDSSGITNEYRTVVISSGGGEAGLIRSVSPPVYLGAIVVCQGADDPAVRLSVIQAVSAVTGVSTDRISVLKMK